MNMKFVAILMVFLAILIGIVPQFTNCAADGRALTLADGRTIPMKCHWTAQAEVAVAAPLVVTAGLLATSKRKETVRVASIVAAVLGIFVVALPTLLVGVCARPEMICNAIMKPSLIAMGGTVTALSLYGVVQSVRFKEETVWAVSGLPGETS